MNYASFSHKITPHPQRNGRCRPMWIITHNCRTTTRDDQGFQLSYLVTTLDLHGFLKESFLCLFKKKFCFVENTGTPVETCLGTEPE